MKKIILLGLLAVFFVVVKSQNSFSFFCQKDTVLSCNTGCITLKARLNNIRAGGNGANAYQANPLSDASNCFRPYIDPGGAGTSANLIIDDRYSALINLGFNFSFYGSIYNQLVVSTNGHICFDASRAGLFSHFGILKNATGLNAASGTPEDLPSTLYDKALIMGPYHDLDPSASTSATQKIQYSVMGLAPHRKFIFSFYKVPLYNGTCTQLIENTAQIVLYESCNIIEVFVYDNQICNSWNQGRSMIGLQDFTRTNAVMPPGRAASSTPWGTTGMKESWRFIPILGPALFRKVELYDMAGNLVSIGDTLSIPGNQFEVNFPNVCPSNPGTTSYIVRSTYEKFDDPAVNIIGTDTIRVISQNFLTANATVTAPSCNAASNGNITVNVTSGNAPFQYAINGGPFQSANVFANLAAATYNITFTDAKSCTGNISVTVPFGPLLAATFTSNPPCSGLNNGTIVVNPSTGTAPYQYAINGGPSQLNNTFNGLAAGTYTISFSDNAGCTGMLNVLLAGSSPVLGVATMVTPLCNGGNTGSISISASGGVSPYQFSMDAGITYQSSPIFNNLIAGNYSIRIKDFNGCTSDVPVALTEPALLTASAVSTASGCSGTDGTITILALGGTPVFQYSINNGAGYQAANTFTVGPGNYNSLLIRDNNGCTASATVNVALIDNMFLTAGADTTVCAGTSVTLQPQTNPQTNIFSWSPTTGLSNPSIKNTIASPADTTTYYLDAQWGACKRKDTITVNVLHKPLVNAGKDTVICNNSIAYLRGTAAKLSGPVSYAWSPANFVNPSNLAFSIARPDITQVFTLTVKDNYGCNFSVSDDVIITVQPPVPAYAGNDTNAVYGVPHQLFGSGGISYLWSPAGPLNNASLQTPLATLFTDTYFNVQVTDIAGCIGNDVVLVKVYKGPTYYIPNAFTPNGDGINDVFRPIPVGIKSTEYFRIYNRYGQLIYETNKWLQGWDGTINGKKQPNGAYVWMIKGIDKNDKTIEMKGQVLIVH
jgi:gliding motility-associated-like protein